MTPDAHSAVLRLWTFAFFVVAFVVAEAIWLAMARLWPDVVDAQVVAPGDDAAPAKLWAIVSAIVWVCFLIGLLAREIRQSLWRPCWVLDRLALAPARK